MLFAQGAQVPSTGFPIRFSTRFSRGFLSLKSVVLPPAIGSIALVIVLFWMYLGIMEGAVVMEYPTHSLVVPFVVAQQMKPLLFLHQGLHLFVRELVIRGAPRRDKFDQRIARGTAGGAPC